VNTTKATTSYFSTIRKRGGMIRWIENHSFFNWSSLLFLLLLHVQGFLQSNHLSTLGN